MRRFIRTRPELTADATSNHRSSRSKKPNTQVDTNLDKLDLKLRAGRCWTLGDLGHHHERAVEQFVSHRLTLSRTSAAASRVLASIDTNHSRQKCCCKAGRSFAEPVDRIVSIESLPFSGTNYDATSSSGVSTSCRRRRMTRQLPPPTRWRPRGKKLSRDGVSSSSSSPNISRRLPR